jgi:hypothetical protein
MKYENLLIGDFIYSLGYACGTMKIKNNKIDLLQQTPADTIIGDLLGDIGGSNFIIEFKKSRALLKTEKEKASKKFLLENVLPTDIMILSKKVHFIAFWENVELLISPYLLLNSKYELNIEEPFSQDRFLKELLDLKIGVNRDEIQKYLNFMAENTTASKSSPSGILVNYLQGRKPLILNISEGFSINQKLEILQGPNMNISKTKAKTKDQGMEM